ncbi:probable folate-biopterin transporter 6 isoform X2 [Cryptomeria japonica]|uniref:probable folate-biopterin transporter 6 isoform X2 n=1 Tax=Cryptomeria japonica TaxID=3369 RepID=UPI0027DA6576|nr:probable folate-biopterin transporter 6 isoform X2 [Cryptomeria japonica]
MEKEDEAIPILLELKDQVKTGIDIASSSSSSSSYNDNENEFTQGRHLGGWKYTSPWEVVKHFWQWFAVMRETFGVPFLGVVMIVYGVSQGYGETVKGLATNYYWRDVQKMQPASTQAFMALSNIPWDLKPIYGLITDTFPIAGYRRWPYLIICGIAGCLFLWALAFLNVTPWVATFLMAAVAMCTAFPDVVADAAVAQRSKTTPELASDLQGSLCPDISEAMFFWLTDPVAGPGFSEEFMGLASAVGYMAMFIGVASYNCWFRYQTFRKMFLWPQVASSFIGLLDIILVTRMNLRMHIPDQAFVLGDEALSDALSRLQIMPLLILSAQLCPTGIEGTVFSFLMSVSNFGNTCGSWFGALLLKWLHVQKDDYSRLWLAVLIRSLLRLSPLMFLFLVPDCTVENIKPPSISLSNNLQMEETSKDIELCSEVSAHKVNECI